MKNIKFQHRYGFAENYIPNIYSTKCVVRSFIP